MRRKKTYILLGVLFPLLGLAQSSRIVDCKQVKNGVFYFYPPGNPKGQSVIRDGEMQTEIDHKTGDTTIWKVNWKTDCLSYLTFVRGSSGVSESNRKFFETHTTVLQVLACEKGYYVFRGGIDSINSRYAVTDTMWFKPRRL